MEEVWKEWEQGKREKDLLNIVHTHHIHQMVWKLVVFGDTVFAVARIDLLHDPCDVDMCLMSDVMRTNEKKKEQNKQKIKTSTREEWSTSELRACSQYSMAWNSKYSEPARGLKINFKNCTSNCRRVREREGKMKSRSEEKYIYHLFERVIYVIWMRLIYSFSSVRARCARAVHVEYILENAC